MNPKIHFFHTTSHKHAVLMCALIGRLSWSGGRKCYQVDTAGPTSVKLGDRGGKKRTVYALIFDPDMWEQTHLIPFRDGEGTIDDPPRYIGQPPTSDMLQGFCMGLMAGGGGSVAALSYKLLGG